MKRLHVHACAALAALSLACSGGSDAAKSDDASGGSASKKSGKSKGGTSDATPKSLTFDDVTPRGVSYLDFRGDRVAIGFADGAIAFVNPSSGEVEHSKVAKAHAVSTISPSGDLALLDANPPVIVNTKGDLILQMNTVPNFESGTFSPDGLGIYVADKDGKVRVWGQAHSFEEDQHKEKLENYLNRQAPDFHFSVAPVRGPIHLTAQNTLVMVDDQGNVRIWDPTRPSSADRVMKVDGGARSIASVGDHLIVTSANGAMKVGEMSSSTYKAWSKDARGGFVAATGLADGEFFMLDSNALQALQLEDGTAKWTTQTPDGFACGLAVSPDAERLAACIGNFIAVFDAESGAPLGYGYRSDGDFEWKSL